jgi:hypothetical protein
MWRARKLYEAGLFDEGLPFYEDLELALRVCLVGKVKNLRAPLYTYRKNISGEITVSVKSQITRATLGRKVFVLKQKKDLVGLNELYKEVSAHYGKTRFEKGIHVPTLNRYYYYMSIALASLVYGDRSGAKGYLSRGRDLEPKAVTNLLLSTLISAPRFMVSFMHKASRLMKKYLYIANGGNVSRYLKKTF